MTRNKTQKIKKGKISVLLGTRLDPRRHWKLFYFANVTTLFSVSRSAYIPFKIFG